MKIMSRNFLTGLLLVLGLLVLGCGERIAQTPVKSVGGFDVAIYNDGEFQELNSTLKISGLKNQGIFFNRDLDPKKKYRLSLAGEDIDGKTTVRLNKDGVLAYTVVGKEGSQWTISGVHHLEILFYSDAPFAYGLADLRLIECVDCGTDDDLKNRILTEIPELEQLLEFDKYGAAVKLLNWASNEYVFALSSDIAIKTNSGIESKSAASLYYDEFQPRTGGSYCAAAAVFFEKILSLFGFNAFTVNFGEIQDDLTHVTVVLNIDDGYFVLDPSFNMQLLRNGKPVSLMEVDWKNFSDVDFYEVPMPRRVFLVEKGEKDKCPVLLSSKNDKIICDVPDWGVGRYIYNSKTQMQKNGILPSTAGFYSLLSRRIFNIKSNCSESYCVKFLEEAKRRHVPVGMPG